MININTAADGATVADPRASLLDLRAAPVGYGYCTSNATDADLITQCHNVSRHRPIGWWNRHRMLHLGIGAALVTNIGFLPAVQDALLSALQHL